MATIIIVLAIALILLLMFGLGTQTSLSAALLPKDVRDAARKAAGDAVLTDAQASFDTFTVQFQGSQGLTQARIYRHGEITVSIARREEDHIPQHGSFTLLSWDDNLPPDEHNERVTLGYLNDTISRALQAAGFSAAGSGQRPTLYVRCLRALDETVTDEDIDRLHGFIPHAPQAAAGSRRTAYSKGSLVIDISSGGNDVLLWRAAAVATINSTDGEERRKSRIEAAVGAMFEYFPDSPDTLLNS